MGYLEKVEKYRQKCPEGTVQVYDALLNDNCAPNIACASVTYSHGVHLGNKATQETLADEFECAAASIQKWHQVAFERYKGKFNFNEEEVENHAGAPDIYARHPPEE